MQESLEEKRIPPKIMQFSVLHSGCNTGLHAKPQMHAAARVPVSVHLPSALPARPLPSHPTPNALRIPVGLAF